MNLSDPGEPPARSCPPARGFIVDKLHAFAVACLLGVSASTALSLASPHHWLSDLLANLRVQQLLGIALTASLCLSLRRWKSLGLAVVLFCVHLPAMKQAWPFRSASETTTNPILTVTTVNVLTGNDQHDRIIEDLMAASPDVFAVLELSSSLADRLQETISVDYPHSVLRPSDHDNFGIGIFSRRPMTDIDVFVLNTTIESIAFTLPEHNVRVFATHTLPPMGHNLFQKRNEHLRQLARRVADYRLENGSASVIVMGDLNLTPWSPVFVEFQSDCQLRRAVESFNLTPTWYRSPIFATGLVLDHVMIDSDLQCLDHRVGHDIGSDHRSVTVDLVR